MASQVEVPPLTGLIYDLCPTLRVNDQSFNHRLTNNIVSFEHLGPDCYFSYDRQAQFEVSFSVICQVLYKFIACSSC